MGTGIGIVAARVAGLQVKLVDANESSLKRSQDFVSSWIQKEIGKERMTAQDKEAMLSKITYHNSIQKLNDVDFAVEVLIIVKIIRLSVRTSD